MKISPLSDFHWISRSNLPFILGIRCWSRIKSSFHIENLAENCSTSIKWSESIWPSASRKRKKSRILPICLLVSVHHITNLIFFSLGVSQPINSIPLLYFAVNWNRIDGKCEGKKYSGRNNSNNQNINRKKMELWANFRTVQFLFWC